MMAIEWMMIIAEIPVKSQTHVMVSLLQIRMDEGGVTEQVGQVQLWFVRKEHEIGLGAGPVPSVSYIPLIMA